MFNKNKLAKLLSYSICKLKSSWYNQTALNYNNQSHIQKVNLESWNINKKTHLDRLTVIFASKKF